MIEFNTEDLDEVIASTNGSLVQILARQLKNELAKITALTTQLESVVAENAALLKFCKDASFDADYEAELGMERGGFTDALNDIKTPATHAFLAEVRASGVDVCRNALIKFVEDEVGSNENVPGLIRGAEVCVSIAAQLRQGGAV